MRSKSENIKLHYLVCRTIMNEIAPMGIYLSKYENMKMVVCGDCLLSSVSANTIK